MTIYTHSIQVSENTFQRLHRQAQAKQTTVSELAEQAIEQALPPSLDHVPKRWRADLEQMQTMSDETLTRIARTEFSAERVDLYDTLLDINRERDLSPSEREQLDTLREESDMLTLRKSYAWLLLKSRGHKIPDPYSNSAHG